MKSKPLVFLYLALALMGGIFLGHRLSGGGGDGSGPISWLTGDDAALRRALADAEERLRALQAELEQLRNQMATKDGATTALRAERDKLSDDLARMRKEVEQLNKEWTFSYGSTRDAGKFMGSTMRDAILLREMAPDDPERAAKSRDMFLKFVSMGPILQEMQKLDDKPKEFAEFRASILAEALGLEDSERGRVAGVVERYKTQYNNLPADSPEREELNQRALSEVTSGFTEAQNGLLQKISDADMSGASDLLGTPSLDPATWRARGQRNRQK
jgi:chorismate mutase